MAVFVVYNMLLNYIEAAKALTDKSHIKLRRISRSIISALCSLTTPIVCYSLRRLERDVMG